jgi:putative ABC transport system permease protein
LQQVSIDGFVVLFAAVISTVTGIAFGLLPALQVSASDPASALREGTRTVMSHRRQNRLDGWLVVGETALGLVLLIASSLLVHSFIKILSVKPGFYSRNVMTASMDVPRSYPNYKRTQIYNQLLSNLGQVPGVKSVAAGWPLPLSDNNALLTFQLEGHPTEPGQSPYEAINIITPAYFRTLRIELLEGRDFSPSDNETSKPVLIVNEKFAQKYFPGQSAIGKHVRADVGDGVTRSPMREIVGVVANTKRRGLTSATDAQYFVPYAQCVIVSPDIVVRTAENGHLNLASFIRRQLATLDRSIPVYGVKTMDTFVSASAAQPRFQALVLTSFSILAVLLSAVGLYAFLSYMVVQRTTELGLRMALGAQRLNIIALIVGRGVSLTIAGLAMGCVFAIGLARVLSSFLFEVEPFDPTSIALSMTVILGVALIASSLPARRAGNLDPIDTLRQQ